jgi:hypothetical protein
VSASQVERRVRLLPSVRSCSIDDQRVTVLVDNATDRRNVAAGVAYILADLGIERAVHVLGGNAPVDEVLPEPRRMLWLVAAGVVAIVCVVVGIALLVAASNDDTKPGVGNRAREPQVTTTVATVATSALPSARPTFPPDWHLRSAR